MFASTFYFLKRKTENIAHFVYGYGLDIGESDFKELRLSSVKGTPKGWKLIRISGTIAKEDLIQQVSEWKENEKNTFNTESLSFPEWMKRPTVYSYDNEIHKKGLKSLTNRTSLVDMYFAMNKSNWLTQLFPTEKLDLPRARKEMEELENLIQNEVGISLFSSDSYRFGNIEIYTSTDYLPLTTKETGVHLKMNREKKFLNENAWKGEYVTTGASLWVDDSLHDHMPLTVNLSLTNDHGNREAIILDEVLMVHKAGKLRDFQTNEPISGYQIKIWSKHGQLLHYEDTHLIRSVNMDMNIRSANKRIRDPWSEKLPKKFKQQVETVETYERNPIKIDGSSFDPWVNEGDLFEEEVNYILRSNEASISRFFPATQEGETQFFLYLHTLFEAKNVKKATLVDPYFGHESLGQFLSRMKTNLPIEFITSLSNKRNDENPSPLEYVKNYIDKNSTLLPPNMDIINVQSKKASEQQFHDRFLLLENKNGYTGYMLGTSFHSVGQKFPGIMVEMPSSVLESVISYIQELREGKITGRNEAKAEMLFSSSRNRHSPAASNKPILPGGLKPFPGWELIISLLIQKEENDSVKLLEECINEGLFEDYNGTYTWEVKADKKEQVIKTINHQIELVQMKESEDYADLTQLFDALSFWTYHGSNILADDILKDQDLTEFLLTRLQSIKTHIKETMNQRDRGWFTLRAVFEERNDSLASYLAFYDLYQYSYEYERLLKQNHFYASYLYHINANAYFSELDQNFVLLPHFLYLLSRKDSFNAAFNSSEIAVRIVLFSILDSHQASTFGKLATSNDIKKKVLLTYLGTIYKEEQWNNAIHLHLPYLLTAAFTDKDLPFIIRIREPFLTELLDHISQHQPDFVSAARMQIINQWVTNITTKEPYYFHASTDYESFKRMVNILLVQFGDQWVDWYSQNFLIKLPWHAYRNPLLKSTQYSKWHSYSIKLLVGLFTGLNALEKISMDRAFLEDEKSLVVTIMNYFKEYLHPAIWALPSDQLLLDDVIYSLAILTEYGELQEENQALLDLIEDKNVSLIRKLSVYFSTQPIFFRSIEQINSLLKSGTFLLSLGEQSMSRLKWISDVLQAFLKNCASETETEKIRSLQSNIMNLIKLASDDMLPLLWKLDLGNPLDVNSQWGKWANTLKVTPHELKNTWIKGQGYEFFLKLIGLGLYLNGDMEGFQQWLHEKHHGLEQTEWQRIQEGKGEKVLEEIYIEISGLGDLGV
jgi:hypothetical protein